MDNFRIFLWVGLALLLWLNVTMWQAQFNPPQGMADSAAETAAATTDLQVPANDQNLPALPSATDAPAVSAAAPEASVGPAGAPTAQPALVSVRTDVLDARINLLGGDLREVRLPRYPMRKDQPDVPVQLLSPEPARYFEIHTGLRAAGGAPEVLHSAALFTTPDSEYVLGPDQEELRVPLTWQSADGRITVEKTLVFRRGRYDVGLEYQVTNGGETPYQAASYLQIERLHQPLERSMFNVDSYSYTGPVAYDGDKYKKLHVEDLAEAPFSQSVARGWLAAIQHHFIVAAVPPPDTTWEYRGTARDGRFTINAIGPLTTVAPGQSATFQARLFTGPKLQKQLEETAENLDLTVDYGRLTLLAQPMFWALETVHGWVGNWGLAIILVTLLIKLAFYKLSETSGRSMARMRKLQPRMQALQERYKDDRAALSQHLMELYKREKINPAAGCLPMLVQIPFFIAFYWVLLESVEMRQAPFFLWINDLSSRDPYFVLPILMGAAMWFQQKLNPAPPDPVQAKVMQIMPVMFTGFFAFFPSGLVLYWLTNSLLSIAQQWRINKVLKAD
jgi:YidC/Oxa1 family membrane protein insertase